MRLAVLEQALDKVTQETTRTSMRVDNIEGSVNRFTDTLESFLGRINIDDRLRLVPDQMRLSPPPPHRTHSGSPATIIEIPNDDDDLDVGVESSSAQDTRTTPSDHQGEVRMQQVGPIASGSGSASSSTPLVPTSLPPAPVPTPLPPAPLPTTVPLPTTLPPPIVTLIPPTPHGSQDVAPPPPTAHAESPLPPPTVVRSRSRTPARELLGVQGRTTRSRSRSKTPI